MNKVSDSMKSLCEDILKCRAERRSCLEKVKDRTGMLRDNTRNFLSEARKSHEEMKKELRKGLQAGRADLFNDIKTLRDNFRGKKREIRADITEAGKIWNKMSNDLRRTRTKSHLGRHMEER